MVLMLSSVCFCWSSGDKADASDVTEAPVIKRLEKDFVDDGEKQSSVDKDRAGFDSDDKINIDERRMVPCFYENLGVEL